MIATGRETEILISDQAEAMLNLSTIDIDELIDWCISRKCIGIGFADVAAFAESKKQR